MKGELKIVLHDLVTVPEWQCAHEAAFKHAKKGIRQTLTYDVDGTDLTILVEFKGPTLHVYKLKNKAP